MIRKINKRIIQFGPGRTGTTLIWQILNYIFGNVEKSHNFINNKNGYNVVTYRDFRDSFLSVMRVYKYDLNVENIKNHFVNGYKNQLDFLMEYKKRNNSIFLRYEIFYNNYDYIYDEIEKYFNIKLSEKEKVDITSYVSLEKNRNRSNKFETFNNYDPNTLIHGYHIYHPIPGYWKEVNKEYVEILNDLLHDYLKEWNYEI